MSDVIIRDGIRAYLLQIVREREGVDLDPTKAVFSDLTLVDPTVVSNDDLSKFNSTVRIAQGASGNDPEVSLLLQYNRLSLAKLFDRRSTSFTLNPSFTSIHDYLPALNARLLSALTAEDITAGTLTGEAQSFTLSAAEGSLYAFGSIAVQLVAEEVPEEEDEMYYTLIPPEMWETLDDSEKSLSVQIGTNCGYPTYLKSSLPNELVFKDLANYANLNQLSLVEGKLYMIANNSPELVSRTVSSFGQNSGQFGPNSDALAAEVSQYPLVQIGSFELLDTGNANRIEFMPIGTNWYDRYANEGGGTLIFRGKLSHPSVVDQKGEPAFIYWSTVLQPNIAPSQEEDDMYYTLIAPQMTYQLDEMNRIAEFKLGDLGNGAPSFYRSSDPANSESKPLSELQFWGGLDFVEGDIFVCNEPNPSVTCNEYTADGSSDGTSLANTNLFVAPGETGIQKIGVLGDSSQVGDTFRTLYTDGSQWWSSYEGANGKHLVIRAKFSHPDVRKANGDLADLWYFGTVLNVSLSAPQA